MIVGGQCHVQVTNDPRNPGKFSASMVQGPAVVKRAMDAATVQHSEDDPSAKRRRVEESALNVLAEGSQPRTFLSL